MLSNRSQDFAGFFATRRLASTVRLLAARKGDGGVVGCEAQSTDQDVSGARFEIGAREGASSDRKCAVTAADKNSNTERDCWLQV